MGTKEVIFKRKIFYDGIFDFEELMGGIKTLLESMNYGVDEGIHKFKDKGGVHGHEIEWEVYKRPDKYIKFIWLVKFVTKNLAPVKIVDDKGVEVVRRQGQVNVLIKAELETDYLNRWDGNPYTRFLKGFFERYAYGKGLGPNVAKGLYAKWVVQIDGEATTVFNEAKALLNLYSTR